MVNFMFGIAVLLSIGAIIGGVYLLFFSVANSVKKIQKDSLEQNPESKVNITKQESHGWMQLIITIAVILFFIASYIFGY